MRAAVIVSQSAANSNSEYNKLKKQKIIRKKIS